MYYGDVTDAEIYLYSNIGTAVVSGTDYEYSLGACPYEVGKKYILVMDRYSSEHRPYDLYVMGADLLICPEGDVYTIYSQPIAAAGNGYLEDYLVNLPNSYTAEAEDSKPEYIAKVRIDELYSEGEIHNGNAYLCSVVTLYNGENLKYSKGGKFMLVIEKDTVEVGGEYTICFKQADEDSSIYVQTRQGDERIALNL